MLLGQRLGFLEARLRIYISKWLVLFGFPGRFFGGFAGFPARVSEGTFGLFQVFWRLVFVVLGGFVEFREAVAVGAGGRGGGEKGSTASFGAILWIKADKCKKIIHCRTQGLNTRKVIGIDFLVTDV